LHKILVLLDQLGAYPHEPYCRHALLALANTVVLSISNLRFGPELGIGKLKSDAPVIAPWLAQIDKMAADLRLVADARQISQFIPPQLIYFAPGLPLQPRSNYAKK
jgi:hypothetical protein